MCSYVLFDTRSHNDRLCADAIRRGLGTRWLGRHLVLKEETDSTNAEAVALARAGAPEGTVVVANYQRAGRGRRGRRWFAPPGTAVLLSAVLRPNLHAEQVGRLGMAGALAVVDALQRTCGLSAAVKYPNDVLLAGRKVCGVLVEAHLMGGCVDWAVLGIGINVRREAVPVELADRAASVEHSVPPPTRNDLIRALLECLEGRLEQARRSPEVLATVWCSLDAVLGRRVCVHVGETGLSGVATRVDRDGRLLLCLPDGNEQWLLPEEVSLRP